MSTIAGIDILVLEGSDTVPAVRQEISIRRRPGISGLTARQINVQPDQFNVRTWCDFNNLNAAISCMEDFADLQGTVVAYRDSDDELHQVFVHEVRSQRRRLFMAMGHNESYPTYGITTDWTFELAD